MKMQIPSSRTFLKGNTASIAVAALCVVLLLGASPVYAQTSNLGSLDQLPVGRARAENALWHENPLSAQFMSSKTVVIADVKGQL